MRINYHRMANRVTVRFRSHRMNLKNHRIQLFSTNVLRHIHFNYSNRAWWALVAKGTAFRHHCHHHPSPIFMIYFYPNEQQFQKDSSFFKILRTHEFSQSSLNNVTHHKGVTSILCEDDATCTKTSASISNTQQSKETIQKTTKHNQLFSILLTMYQ